MFPSASDKITQATVNHLNKTLSAPFYVNDYSTEQYLQLVSHLFDLFDEPTISSHTLAIEKGFKLFFQRSNQEIDIKLSVNTIKLSKVLKSSGINLTMDKALFKLNQKLHLLQEEMKSFEVHSYLHEFPTEKVLELHESFKDLELSKSETFSYIREEVSRLLELHKRDIILFLSQKMYIRNFVPPNKKENLSEQRFNGCDPEKLASIYTEKFPDDFSATLLEMVPDLETSSLNFTTLDNATFHNKLADTLRSLLDIAMLPYVEEFDEDTVLALNGYILRIHFHEMLEEMAKILMEKILQRDKQADEFLKYYNGETILNSKGKRVKKPSIVDTNNNTWNFSAIFSILTQHKQTEKNLHSHEDTLDEKEALHHKLENDLKAMQSEHTLKVQELDRLKQSVLQEKMVHNKVKQKCEKSSDKALKSELNAALKSLRKKEVECDSANDVVNNLSLKLENLKTEANNRKQHYKKEKKTVQTIEASFNELDKSYDLIKAALAKAITGR